MSPIDLATALDPSILLERVGMVPDGWQRSLMRSRADRVLLNAARQSGKSTTTACLAVWTALYDPGLVVMTSPSQRQSGELYRKVLATFRALGNPVEVVEESATALSLANGSRLVSLPGSPDTVRSFSSPNLVIIDEAARASNDLLLAVSPMLAVSRGRLVCLSSPRGKRGFFSDLWHEGGDDWERILLRARDNPRVDPAWLEQERRTLGARMFAQEYDCEFVDTQDQAFDTESVERAFDDALAPVTFEVF